MPRQSVAEQFFTPAELVDLAKTNKILSTSRFARDRQAAYKPAAKYLPKTLHYAATLERMLAATEESYAAQTLNREGVFERIAQLTRLAEGFIAVKPLEKLHGFGVMNERDVDLVHYFGTLFADVLKQLSYEEMADHKFHCAECQQTFYITPTIENLRHPERLEKDLHCPYCTGVVVAHPVQSMINPMKVA